MKKKEQNEVHWKRIKRNKMEKNTVNKIEHKKIKRKNGLKISKFN